MHALEDAYRETVPGGRFPTAVLLVELDPSAVDVNVHPTKAEVRLSREPEVHHLVAQAARQALQGFGAAGHAEISFAPTRPSGAPIGPVFNPEAPAQGALPGGWAGTLGAPNVLSAAFQQGTSGTIELRPLAQLRQTYILAESAQGLLLVDQHRAQERVLYERFTAARLSQRPQAQALLTPGRGATQRARSGRGVGAERRLGGHGAECRAVRQQRVPDPRGAGGVGEGRSGGGAAGFGGEPGGGRADASLGPAAGEAADHDVLPGGGEGE